MPKEKNIDISNAGYYIGLTGKFIKLAASKDLRDNDLNDLTLEQYGLLYTLSIEDGMYQRQLAKAILKDRPNIARLINILENLGMIEKRQDKTNKKIYKIFLTKRGKEEVAKLTPIRNNFFKKAFKDINNEDINILLSLLEKVRENIGDDFKIQT